ncbi:hypothetical protein H7I53_17910 [Mycolicibacterium pulveris]|nr:hypothetical protein [Mycolicibacterium pulveris]
MRQAFKPDGECPPVGGGSETVRFFAGDDGVLAYWDPNGRGCEDPFLWVRLWRRYRSSSKAFPAAVVANRNCRNKDTFAVVEVEIGVGRCASTEVNPKWSVLETEAEVSLDDSWRIETALRTAACRLQSETRAVATDTVAASGPEGGLIAWTGVAYVQI